MESLIPTDSALYRDLSAAAQGKRCVVFAGLPGIGKSLLTRQTARIAHGDARDVALMQWDTVRTVFEHHPAGKRFPDADGVAHPVIRLAADDWARLGVQRWLDTVAASALLIIEAPLIGGRMMSLARTHPDRVEPFLANETLFALPVPTRAVKDVLRARRGADEARDPSVPFAAVDVLDALVREINTIAATIGATPVVAPFYHPEAYAAVYLHAMRGRRTRQISIDNVFDIDPRALRESDRLVEITPTDSETALALDAAAQIPTELAEQRLLTWYS